MNKTTKKKVISLAIISVLIISVVLIFVSCFVPTKTVTVQRKVSSVYFDHEGYDVYISCYDDDVKYVFNEKGNGKIEDFMAIKYDDNVEITVRENYKEFHYALIYKIVVNDVVLYDGIVTYNQHDTNVAVVFFISALAMLFSVLIAILIKKRVSSDSEFMLKNIKDLLLEYAGLAVMSGGFFGFLAFWVIHWMGAMDIATAMFSLVFLFLSALGGLCWHFFSNNERGYVDCKYYKKLPFHQKQVAQTSGVGGVEIMVGEHTWSATLFDKNNTVLVEFSEKAVSNESNMFFDSFITNKLRITLHVSKPSVYYVKNIIERLNAGYGRSKLSLWIEGKQYDISCGKSGYEIVKSGEDNSVRFSSLEELYDNYTVNQTSIRSYWNEIERFAIRSYTDN